MYVDTDCSLLEINPLVVTKDGQLVALDAKINFDSNALYRQKDVLEMRDLTEEEESEVRAADSGLSYVKLEGNIGCLVNGAGLAMGTMDIIKLHRSPKRSASFFLTKTSRQCWSISLAAS